MPSYETWQTTTLPPPWLRGPWGRKLQKVLGFAKDLLVSGAKLAVKSAFPREAPADALPYIGTENNLERYPVDTDATYRARIAAPWSVWEYAGTTTGILAAYRAAGFTGDTKVWNTFAAPGWWGGAWPPPVRVASGWSRFWVELPEPIPFPCAPVTWGSGRKWGTHAAQGWTWGSTASPANVALAKSIVRKWRPAHEVCAELLVRLSGGAVLVRWPGG